jgi:hypothetical protein
LSFFLIEGSDGLRKEPFDLHKGIFFDMPRATRSQAERAPVGTSTSQPDIEEDQPLTEYDDLLPDPNNGPTQKVVPPLLPLAHKPTPKEIEILIDKLPNRASRNLSDNSSIAVFPYILEPDKTTSFPFSKDANKHFAKTAMYHPNQFSPKHKPEDNWPAFLKEVWKHLEHYKADGISPEQYEVMLKPHFSQVVWAHIYEDHVSSEPNPEERALACRTVLHI